MRKLILLAFLALFFARPAHAQFSLQEQQLLKQMISQYITGGYVLGGSPAFSGITAGTNTGQAMIIGNGSSLTVGGTGTNKANRTTCTGTDVLLFDGTCTPLSAATAAGSDTQVQFNDGGTLFGGDAGLTYNKTTNVLTAGGFAGPITGAVTGNVTGNLTGDVTGNLTGAVTGSASGNQPLSANLTSLASVTASTILDNSKDYCADTGASDSYACLVSPAPAALVVGMTKYFKANTANTGAATFNLNNLGNIALKKASVGTLVDLETGDIAVNQIVEVKYDSNGNWQVMNPGKAGASGITGTLSTATCLAREASSTSVQCSGWVDDGAGTSSYGTVSGNHHELLFASPTGTHQHTFPAVDGNVAQSTGTLTSGRFAKFDASSRIIQSAATTIQTSEVGAALKTKSITFSIGSDTGSALVDTQDETDVWRNNIAALTITEVWCSTDSGTSTINLQRNDGTPANVLSSNLTCSTSGATGTIDTSEDNFAVGDRLNFVLVTAAATGTPHRITVNIAATLD